MIWKFIFITILEWGLYLLLSLWLKHKKSLIITSIIFAIASVVAIVDNNFYVTLFSTITFVLLVSFIPILTLDGMLKHHDNKINNTQKTRYYISDRLKGVIGLLLLFGVLLSAVNIAPLFRDKNTAPVCVSQRFEVSQSGSGIKVTGQIKNISSETITIDEMFIALTGSGGYKTTYHANYKVNNLTLEPDETYFVDKSLAYNYSQVYNAFISYVQIGDTKHTDIKYSSDGSSFEDQSEPTIFSSPLMLIIGIVMIGCGIAIYFIKREPVAQPSKYNAVLSKENIDTEVEECETDEDLGDDDIEEDDVEDEIIELDNNDAITTISDTDEVKKIISEIIDEDAKHMANKNKMKKFSEMFHQPFDKVVAEEIISICNHKSKMYSFHPNYTMSKTPNAFAYLIEIPYGNKTRYFASEYSHGFYFVLTEWVFDKSKKIMHINHGYVFEKMEDLLQHRKLFKDKIRKIIKNEEKD